MFHPKLTTCQKKVIRSRLIPGALVVFAAASPAPGGSQEVPLVQPREIFTSSTLEITGPALSPDGRWIAFTGRPSADRTSLYLIPADGGTEESLIQVTRGRFSDGPPAWSPDSRTLYFASDRIGGPESGAVHLFRVTIDQETGATIGPPQPLSMEAVEIPYRGEPVVSPDGDWIAFAAEKPGRNLNTAIQVVPSRGGAMRELTPIRRVSMAGLGWSEDSRYVLWDDWAPRGGSEGGVHRVPLAGGEPEQVLPFELEEALPAEGARTWVGFSGDGRGLLRGRRSESTEFREYVVADVQDEPLTAFSVAGGGGRFQDLNFDGSSVLGQEQNREWVVWAAPVTGEPERLLMAGPCPLEVKGPTADGSVLVYAWCPLPASDSSRAPDLLDRISLVNPRDGSTRDVSLHAADVLRSGPRAIHPDGRHVLVSGSTGPGEPGNRESRLAIVDLETGASQTVNVSPYSTSVLGLTLGNNGFYMFGPDAYVFGDRFLYFAVQDGSLKLMSVRPGEDPTVFWTLPPEIVTVTDETQPGNGPMKGDPVGVFGTRIAWVRTNYGGTVTDQTRSTLMVTDAATGRTTQVNTVDGYLSLPIWSRGGDQIACQYEPAEGRQSTFAVFSFSEEGASTSEPRVVEAGTRQSADMVGWSEDDEGLVVWGSGIESLEDEKMLLLPLDGISDPVSLSNEDLVPTSVGLTWDGSILVYSGVRITGSTILRYDLPAAGGGEVLGSEPESYDFGPLVGLGLSWGLDRFLLQVDARTSNGRVRYWKMGPKRDGSHLVLSFGYRVR